MAFRLNLNKLTMKIFIRQTIVIFLFCTGVSFIATCGNQETVYRDVKHYSKVFGREKTYRLYLPNDYSRSSQKYPVIYFFHGWGGRYFKDDNAKLAYDKIGALVNKYKVILVMWDGSMDEAEPRPYNIGNHNDVKYRVQMKDYFPELIAHVDSTYRTLTDRNHRGIIGFSMGGIMSCYLAGKYPDRISAAVNMVGSTEFFIGLPENHTLYQVKYTFDNLRDVGLLFHNRELCPMTGLNDEVDEAAHWNAQENYEYHKLEGDHKVDDPGETKVFESAVRFVVNQFDRPAPMHKKWSHYDDCPEFSLWDYTVKSTKNETGFLFLRNVDASGFGFYTHKWLPDGPAVKNCRATITTAPIYEPNGTYEIRIFNGISKKMETVNSTAGKDGRLAFNLTGEGSEIGISRKSKPAGFVTTGYQLNQGQRYLRINEPGELTLNLFNRGVQSGANGKLRITLSCEDNSVSIPSPQQEIIFNEDQPVFNSKAFKISSTKTPPKDGSPPWLQMKVEMDYDTLHSTDNFLLPVFYEVPEFNNILVDDGIRRSTSKSPSVNDQARKDSIFGTGNGDGRISAGEQIMLYEKTHRLRLYTDDPYVAANDEKLADEVLPSFWPDGFTLSSVVKIADNCPAGHEIEFLASYDTKTWNPIHRTVTWGKVKIKVGARP